MLQVKKYILWFVAASALFFNSCSKEELEPGTIGKPKFFVEANKDEKPFALYSGQNKYHAVGFTQYAGISFLSFCMYNAIITNGSDTFQVGLPDFQFGVMPSQETLDNLLVKLSNNNGNQYMDFPGVFMRVVDDYEVYSTPSDEYLQNGSYFNILKVEDYTPPGETIPMKKADIEFKCNLMNEKDSSDIISFTNGKATLLFSYQL